MKKILGLDISSSTIGYSVMEYDEDSYALKEHGHIKPIKSDKGTLAFRASHTISVLEELFKKINPDCVAFEDYVNKFSKGRSTARTIIVLSVFNESASIACIRALGFEPSKYPVVTIRSKLSKLSGLSISSKEECFDFIKNSFSDFSLLLDKKSNIKEESLDEADSIAVCLTHIIKEREDGKGHNIQKRSKRKASSGGKKTS